MILTGQTLVDKAVAYATEAHRNQSRANGETPYITHPLDVMSRFEGYYADSPTYSFEDLYRGRALAALHDVAEDQDVTFAQLSDAGFESIIPELELLTKFDGTSYLDYLLRLRRSGNRLALDVKLCDMASNLADLSNIPSAGRRKAMQTKYELARYVLTHS